MDVGDMAYLPIQVAKDHPAYELAALITRDPGPIISIVDDWATVDRGRYGQFGCAVKDLIPVRVLTEAQRVALVDQFDAWCDERLQALAENPLPIEDVTDDLVAFTLDMVAKYGREATGVLRDRVNERAAAGTWFARRRIVMTAGPET